MTALNTAALFRLSLISALFLMNGLCLIRMLCCSYKINHCIHTITCGFMILCASAYLSSWIPYLFHSFYNSTVWPLIDIKDHCIIQHSVSCQIITMLLAILCIRKLYDAFSPKTAKTCSYAACIAWIIPQLVYLTMAEVVNVDDNNSYHFLDRVQTNSNSSLLNSHKLVSEGFILCVHKMSSAVIAQMSWHYVVLVIPLTAMLLICLAANYVKHLFINNSSNDCFCNCSSDIIITICLYINFIWLLLVRPLVALQTLMSQSDKIANNDWPAMNPLLQQTQSVYLDFGNHLVIIITAIFVPFSTHGGFRTDISKRIKTVKPQKYCPSDAIKALEANYLDLDISKDMSDSDSYKGITGKITDSYYKNTL